MGYKVSKIYVGTTKVRPSVTPITTPGIYHNATLGLISLSSDGSNWITIADKNLGATQVYNYGDTLSSANGGYVYQRGNNYGFPYTGSISTSTSLIDASSYGPGNYYSSSTYRYNSSNGHWDSSYNRNLWGDTTDTLEARRGPCPTGFHVAKISEWETLRTIMSSLGATSQTNWCTYLKIPKTGYRGGSSGGTAQSIGTNAYRRSSSPYDVGTYANYNARDMAIESSIYTTDNSGRASGLAIRPMKNEPVTPDSSRTKLY